MATFLKSATLPPWVRTYIIPQEKMQFCLEEAAKRNQKKAKPKIRIQGKISTRTEDSLPTHIRGYICEYGAAAYFGVELKSNILAHGDKHEPDFWVGPYGFEVKSARRFPPVLKFDEDEFGKRSHWALLCRYYEPFRMVEIHGGIARKRFFALNKWRDFGYGLMRVADNFDLSDAFNIREYVWKKTGMKGAEG